MSRTAGKLDAASRRKKENKMSDKSEIMEMPTGKSSEEIDALMMEGETETADADDTLAQEALDATESSPAEDAASKEDVEEKAEDKPEEEQEEEELSEEQQLIRGKDLKITSLKKSSKELEIANARLQGQLEARKELQQTAEPEIKSPLQLAKEAYLEENDNLDGFGITVDVYEAQEAFKDEQRLKQTQATQATESQNAVSREVETLQAGDFSAEKVGAGLDFKTIVGLGQGYLDETDLAVIQTINKGRGQKAALKKTYELCKDAILAQDNEDSKLLNIAISKVGKKKSQTKPTKEKTDIDALTTEDEDDTTGEAEKRAVNPRLSEFLSDKEFFDGNG